MYIFCIWDNTLYFPLDSPWCKGLCSEWVIKCNCLGRSFALGQTGTQEANSQNFCPFSHRSVHHLKRVHCHKMSLTLRISWGSSVENMAFKWLRFSFEIPYLVNKRRLESAQSSTSVQFLGSGRVSQFSRFLPRCFPLAWAGCSWERRLPRLVLCDPISSFCLSQQLVFARPSVCSMGVTIIACFQGWWNA